MTESQSFHSFAHLLSSGTKLDDADGWPLRFYDAPATESGYGWLLLFAGLAPSAIAVYLDCSLPPIHGLSWLTLFLRSSAYVSLTALVCLAGFWIFWSFFAIKPSFQPAILSFGTCGISMFFPATSLLFSQHSWWVFVILVCMSHSAALCLRALCPLEEQQTQVYSTNIFRGLAPERTNLRGTLLLSFFTECSILFLLSSHLFFTCVLLSISFFLLGWRLEFHLDKIRRVATDIRLLRQRILRQYLLAVFITALALIPFLRGESWAKGFSLLLGSGSIMQERTARLQKPAAVGEDDSFLGIILLPPPRKKAEIVFPKSHAAWIGTWTKSQPLVIPFDGPYWYFKPPEREPGLRAHVVRGKSTDTNIHSIDRRPIVMEAHQFLGTAIDPSCCREIQVAITNADTSAGRISLGVSLVNSTLPNPSLIKGQAETLGVKAIQSSEPQDFSMKRSPVEEVLTFPIPPGGKFSQFDQIKVLFFPAPERSLKLPKWQFAISGWFHAKGSAGTGN
jgi:hypothetical protein